MAYHSVHKKFINLRPTDEFSFHIMFSFLKVTDKHVRFLPQPVGKWPAEYGLLFACSDGQRAGTLKNLRQVGSKGKELKVSQCVCKGKKCSKAMYASDGSPDPKENALLLFLFFLFLFLLFVLESWSLGFVVVLVVRLTVSFVEATSVVVFCVFPSTYSGLTHVLSTAVPNSTDVFLSLSFSLFFLSFLSF